jgi:hypothetical protein
MNMSPKLNQTFRMSTFVMLLALVSEFILGMYTALFVHFPDTLVKGNAWEWAMAQSPVIVTHVVLGSIMAILSILIFIFGIALKNKAAIVASFIGLAMIWFAYLSGSVFLVNIEEDSYSFTMSIGFIAAMVAYGVGVSFARPGAK